MKYELGQKLYYVEAKNYAFQRKKVTKVDEDGVEWYRYDRPLWMVKRSEYTIIGRIFCTADGVVPDYEIRYDEYFTDREGDDSVLGKDIIPAGTKFEDIKAEFNRCFWFDDKETADAAFEEMLKIYRETQ